MARVVFLLVFVCANIADFIDVPKVVEAAKQIKE